MKMSRLLEQSGQQDTKIAIAYAIAEDRGLEIPIDQMKNLITQLENDIYAQIDGECSSVEEYKEGISASGYPQPLQQTLNQIESNDEDWEDVGSFINNLINYLWTKCKS
jgi:hypothetical protein